MTNSQADAIRIIKSLKSKGTNTGFIADVLNDAGIANFIVLDKLWDSDHVEAFLADEQSYSFKQIRYETLKGWLENQAIIGKIDMNERDAFIKTLEDLYAIAD